MKITEVSKDGLGVSALIAAARYVSEMLDDRNVELALIEGVGEGGGIAFAITSLRGQGLPTLAVTIENNPRLISLGGDDGDA